MQFPGSEEKWISRKTKVEDNTNSSDSSKQKFKGAYAPPIKKILVSANTSSDKVVVKASSGEIYEFPIIWLRENCQCPECFNHSAMARSFLMENLDLSIKIKEVEVTQYDDVAISWSDGHQSTYLASWLEARAFTEDARKQYRMKYRLPKVNTN